MRGARQTGCIRRSRAAVASPGDLSELCSESERHQNAPSVLTDVSDGALGLRFGFAGTASSHGGNNGRLSCGQDSPLTASILGLSTSRRRGLLNFPPILMLGTFHRQGNIAFPCLRRCAQPMRASRCLIRCRIVAIPDQNRSPKGTCVFVV